MNFICIELKFSFIIPEIKRFVFYPKKFECVVEFEESSSVQSLIETQKSLQFPMQITQLPQDQPQAKKPPQPMMFRESNEFPVMNAKSGRGSSAVEMLSNESRSDVNAAKQELENLMRRQAHTAEER